MLSASLATVMASKNNQFRISAQNFTLNCFDEALQEKWDGPFFFIQGADTQFGMIDGFIKKLPDPKWDEEVRLTRQTILAVNKMKPKPKFFVVCGDLLDAFPETDGQRRTLQEQDFKAVFAELDKDIPLVCVCGNHDIGNTPTKETIQRYRNDFGDDYFSFWCGGVFFIVINSQYYWDRSLVQELAEQHDKWLDEQLSRIKASGCKHSVIFQHIPWFLVSADEADHEIFNIKTEIRIKILEKLVNAGINAIFCGHYHRNAGGRYKNIEQVVTSAIGAQIGSDPHGVRIVKVLDDVVKHEYFAIDRLPEHVDL